jgi:hypothetical protein
MKMVRAKSTATKSTAKKSTATKAAGNGSLDKATVDRVIALRSEGKNWAQIMEAEGKGVGFVHAVRKVMKERDPNSVRNTGPGSPGYGQGRKPAAKKATAKKATAKKTVAKKTTARRATRAKKVASGRRKTTAA